MLTFSHAPLQQFLLKSLGHRCGNCPHFTAEDTEAQGGCVPSSHKNSYERIRICMCWIFLPSALYHTATLGGSQAEPRGRGQTGSTKREGRRAGCGGDCGLSGEGNESSGPAASCYVGSQILCSRIVSFSEKVPKIWIFI